MYYLLWNYTIKDSSRAIFEEEYGRDGTWFHFFAQSDHYMGLELLRSNAATQQYLLIDKWSTRQSYDDFICENKMEYDGLTKRFKTRIENEESAGNFNLIAP